MEKEFSVKPDWRKLTPLARKRWWDRQPQGGLKAILAALSNPPRRSIAYEVYYRTRNDRARHVSRLLLEAVEPDELQMTYWLVGREYESQQPYRIDWWLVISTVKKPPSKSQDLKIAWLEYRKRKAEIKHAYGIAHSRTPEARERKEMLQDELAQLLAAYRKETSLL